MSLEPGMITDARLPGARSVPGGRRPRLLICAPLGRDIAAGVAGGSVGVMVPAPVGWIQTEFRSSPGFRMRPLYTSVRMLEAGPKPPLSAMCSTTASGGVIFCKFNAHHGMGTPRGVRTSGTLNH
jgi:hypothetical protein